MVAANCEFGSSPVCLQLPASVLTGRQHYIAMSYRHPRTTPVATAVQIRRAEEGSPGGFTVGGGAGTIEWVGPAGGGESETPHSGVLRAGVGGGRGGRDPPPRVLYKIPLMAHLHGKKLQVPADAQAPSPYLNKPIKHLFSEVLVLEESYSLKSS